MILHPYLSIALIPLQELEIIFKGLYDQKERFQSIESYLAQFSPEYRCKILEQIQDECVHETGVNQEKFGRNVEIYRHKRYYPSVFHRHDYFELCYLVNGTGEIEIEQRLISLKEEDICIIPPQVSHRTLLFNGGICISLLILKDYFINQFNSFLTEQNLMSAFFTQGLYFKNENSYLLFHTYGDENIRRMMETILLEYFNETRYSNLLVDSFLSSTLNFLLRDHMEEMEYETNFSNISPLIAEIQQYIQENIQTVTLKSIAEHFNYSVEYMSRLIKTKASYSFSELLVAERIRRACGLIVNTNINIAQVASLIGYDSQRQFNRMFKKATNFTPSDYRAMQERNRAQK